MVEATAPESFSTRDRDRAAFTAFIRLADLWQLSTDQQITLLGSPARSTFFKWKKEGGLLPPDTIERISHLVSIYKCLNILFPDPQRADDWIRRQNHYWHEQSALDRMLSGKMADIIDVRRYLDAQRGG
ncbi:antitoxin Xre-like helix-turn-helix domain-containing protein [Sphingomonas sp. ASV193]|uniref:MbcA/ParS/Xre antitoxin family protein n=1 Tax=Sphingomonas sp. ASV193 TaxID=3144405 RepID=UPI0032E92CA6